MYTDIQIITFRNLHNNLNLIVLKKISFTLMFEVKNGIT